MAAVTMCSVSHVLAREATTMGICSPCVTWRFLVSLAVYAYLPEYESERQNDT